MLKILVLVSGSSIWFWYLVSGSGNWFWYLVLVSGTGIWCSTSICCWYLVLHFTGHLVLLLELELVLDTSLLNGVLALSLLLIHCRSIAMDHSLEQNWKAPNILLLLLIFPWNLFTFSQPTKLLKPKTASKWLKPKTAFPHLQCIFALQGPWTMTPPHGNTDLPNMHLCNRI